MDGQHYLSPTHTGKRDRTPTEPGMKGVDNVIATLEHNNHVFDIKLSDVPNWQLERFVAAMQKPFPKLTSLDIGEEDRDRYYHDYCQTPPPVIPDSFLGGSASAPGRCPMSLITPLG